MPPVQILAAATAPAHPMSTGEIVIFLIAAVLVYAGAYSLSIRRHPYRACTKCEGSGKHRGTLFKGSFRACNRCGGTGRRLRSFARDPRTGVHEPRRTFEPAPDRIARRNARRAERARDH